MAPKKKLESKPKRKIKAPAIKKTIKKAPKRKAKKPAASKKRRVAAKTKATTRNRGTTTAQRRVTIANTKRNTNQNRKPAPPIPMSEREKARLLRNLRKAKDTTEGRGAKAFELGRQLLAEDVGANIQQGRRQSTEYYSVKPTKTKKKKAVKRKGPSVKVSKAANKRRRSK